MRKKSETKKHKFNEWQRLLIAEEMRHGLRKKDAERVAVEVIHTLPLRKTLKDTTNKVWHLKHNRS